MTWTQEGPKVQQEVAFFGLNVIWLWVNSAFGLVKIQLIKEHINIETC